MAPRLSNSQREALQSLIESKLEGKLQITDAAIATNIGPCTTRTVRRARSNILRYGTIEAPKSGGRRKEVTENMWLAVRYHLEKFPCTSQQQMVDILHKQYGVTLSRWTLGRTLKRVKWTKKVTQNIAKERSSDLRDDYQERRSHYEPEQMIFIDESGCDRGIAILDRGYAPKGVTPVQVKRFHRGKRVQILPAYTVDGVIYCEVYEQSTDADKVGDFLMNLLPFCGRYPEPRSVIFMDNASFHFFTPEVKKAISEAGVIIEYQPPYSPDLNPIEYLFGSIKNRIRERSLVDGDLIQGDLKSYILMQVRIMGMDKRVARGHFKKAQIEIQED